MTLISVNTFALRYNTLRDNQIPLKGLIKYSDPDSDKQRGGFVKAISITSLDWSFFFVLFFLNKLNY